MIGWRGTSIHRDDQLRVFRLIPPIAQDEVLDPMADLGSETSCEDCKRRVAIAVPLVGVALLGIGFGLGRYFHR